MVALNDTLLPYLLYHREIVSVLMISSSEVGLIWAKILQWSDIHREVRIPAVTGALLHFVFLLRKQCKIPLLATSSKITFSRCFSFPSPTLLHKPARSTVTRPRHQTPTPSLQNSPSLPRSQPQGIEMRNADRLLEFLS